MIGDYVLNKIIHNEQIDSAELKQKIVMDDQKSLQFFADDILMTARQYVLQSCSFVNVIGKTIDFSSNDVENLIAASINCRNILKAAEEVAAKVLSFHDWKDNV